MAIQGEVFSNCLQCSAPVCLIKSIYQVYLLEGDSIKQIGKGQLV